jgi:hypothetical protein
LFSLGLSVISVPEGTLSKKKMWNFRSWIWDLFKICSICI